MRSSGSLVYNRFYIVYDYNHYNIVYDNQCSIYSGTKLSISNFECPPFELLALFRGFLTGETTKKYRIVLPLWVHFIIIHTYIPPTSCTNTIYIFLSHMNN